MDDAAEGAVGAAAACAMLESIRVPVSAAAEIRADANLEAVGISTPAMIAHPCPCHPKAIYRCHLSRTQLEPDMLRSTHMTQECLISQTRMQGPRFVS